MTLLFAVVDEGHPGAAVVVAVVAAVVAAVGDDGHTPGMLVLRVPVL